MLESIIIKDLFLHIPKQLEMDLSKVSRQQQDSSEMVRLSMLREDTRIAFIMMIIALTLLEDQPVDQIEGQELTTQAITIKILLATQSTMAALRLFPKSKANTVTKNKDECSKSKEKLNFLFILPHFRLNNQIWLHLMMTLL